jgi:hypothetical protein
VDGLAWTRLGWAERGGGAVTEGGADELRRRLVGGDKR